MRDPRDRIDEIKTAIDNLKDDYEGQIERVSKERDDWRERYEELAEVTARRIDEAANRSC
jgi:hypothetical protein